MDNALPGWRVFERYRVRAERYFRCRCCRVQRKRHGSEFHRGDRIVELQHGCVGDIAIGNRNVLCRKFRHWSRG